VPWTLKPGQTLSLGQPYLVLQPPDWEGKIKETTLKAKPGTYRVSYHCDLGLKEELTSGQLELEVVEAAAPAQADAKGGSGSGPAPGADQAAAVRREQARFQGKWRLIAIKELLAPDQVAERRGGAWVAGPGLEAARRRDVRGVFYTFQGDRLTVTAPPGAKRDRGLWFDSYQIRVDPSRTPKALDLTPLGPTVPEEVRRPAGAIYMLDGNELWIADFSGNAGREPNGDLTRPRNFDLSVGIAYPLRVLVLRRVTEPGGAGKEKGPP
jgi:uncharacterized protein (TIGR03067 family)